jgi:mono/diheme cytochrome c family protein
MRNGTLFALSLISAVVAAPACGPGEVHRFEGPLAVRAAALSSASARVVATGIPGAGAIAQVGAFLPGGPLHDRPGLARHTPPGLGLEARRLLVSSASNFGAPRGRADQPEGSVLSIDPALSGFAVPGTFAAAGGQAATADGLVQVYTANGPGFVNAVNNPGAATAGEVAASLPTGISLNSGSGRPWFANAPAGAAGKGTITVIDPDGTPLAGPPSPVAGGVFAGDETNRSASSTSGLTAAALGTAMLTKSPDLTGRAVFAALLADGRVVQLHVQKGVDGLAPAGTVTPLATLTPEAMTSTDPHIVARAGMLFNWAPTANLFIADPQANRLVVLDLADDGTMFSAARRTITSAAFDWPIDLAPAAREVAHANFASNTTLGGGSDLYVLNRGNNTIVRLSVTGQLIDGRQIASDLPGFRASGIAVSEDGQTIWVTATLPGGDGAVLELPAFGAAQPSARLIPAAIAGGASTMAAIGEQLFSHEFGLDEGVGPLFNARSCVACHGAPFVGGMGTTAAQGVQLFARIKANGAFDPMLPQGGPSARAHSVTELGQSCGLTVGVPALANVVSPRSAMTLRGDGLLDTILLGDALANMARQPEAIRGRPNILADGRWGKLGWKANVPTVIEFMGEAFRNELGLTSPLRPADLVDGCGANLNGPELDALLLQASAAFLDTLDPPVPSAACLVSEGAAQFTAIGCAGCHTPALPGRGTQVRLYSDLLLHDMGAGLADGMQQGAATGSEWRTMPLWRVSERTRLLHDGRARSIEDAVAQHGGQATAARDAFTALDAAARQAVIEFLGCI